MASFVLLLSAGGAARRALLTLVLLMSLGVAARAQQPATIIRLTPEDQQRGLNGVQKNFFFTTGLGTTEEEYQNAGFFGQRLRPYLAANSAALDNLNLYRRQKWLFLTERLVFVGAVGVYAQQVLAKDTEQQYFNRTQQVAAGVAAASLLSNIFISRYTNQHLQQAVEAYNAGPPAARTGALRRLRPAGLGVGATPAGRPVLALRWNL
ncbi:hypothetical protein [Hymenobacter weizhouensis]|uniref:hypothetical protein n=1 Tax=Hymenobacter sp. YIM 151500-1 TaxID=2987689 RepID=UPI0022260FDB|nr:hypothetical protein [Hymenobacter sp. YIM 151500-1]UYZ62854.1 hypothetical protein OIS53_17885 [Hymenobacter sp. YIM 151500-1]